MSACPCCGRALPKAKAPKVVTLPERQTLDEQFSRKDLTHDQYFAACKSIGARDDLRFFLRVADPIPPDVRAHANTLLAQLEIRSSKPADYQAINSLRDRYRKSRYRQQHLNIVEAEEAA